MLAASLAAAGATRAAAHDLTVPKGTFLELAASSAFDSDHVKKGDRFTATVTRGLRVEDQLAIPAGSTVTGEIKSVRAPHDGSKSGAIGVKFESLEAGGKTYDIEGILVSLKADERKRMLDQQGKLLTGRHVDVILIGGGTEADMRADTLVGISGLDRDDLADEWARSGLGPSTVRVQPGTTFTMEFDKALSLDALPGARTADERNIYVSTETVKSLQRALRGRNYYAGEATGTLDRPTREAIARFQLDRSQAATGDADEATVQALGVTTAGLR